MVKLIVKKNKQEKKLNLKEEKTTVRWLGDKAAEVAHQGSHSGCFYKIQREKKENGKKEGISMKKLWEETTCLYSQKKEKGKGIG